MTQFKVIKFKSHSVSPSLTLSVSHWVSQWVVLLWTICSPSSHCTYGVDCPIPSRLVSVQSEHSQAASNRAQEHCMRYYRDHVQYVWQRSHSHQHLQTSSRHCLWEMFQTHTTTRYTTLPLRAAMTGQVATNCAVVFSLFYVLLFSNTIFSEDIVWCTL